MSVELLVRETVRPLVGAELGRKLRAVTRTSLRALGRSRSSVTLLLTDDREIRVLNRDYRRHDRATDVLSFHLQELTGPDDPAGDGVNLGDIVISVETARRRAGSKRLEHELVRLATHGLCHLFGHDHQRPKQAKLMFALERRLLRAFRSAP